MKELPEGYKRKNGLKLKSITIRVSAVFGIETCSDNTEVVSVPEIGFHEKCDMNIGDNSAHSKNFYENGCIGKETNDFVIHEQASVYMYCLPENEKKAVQAAKDHLQRVVTDHIEKQREVLNKLEETTKALNE